MNPPMKFDYDAPKDLLKDKIILVTGAGDGIGRAAAISYAAHGATVLLLGKTEDKLSAVYDEIEAAGYPTPVVIPLHLEHATEENYANLSNQIEEGFGRLDGLLNNASLLGEITPIQNYPADLWNQIMQVNVNATFLITKALIPILSRSSSASILFTSSTVGRVGRAHWGAYAISKFATEGLMQTLADELANTTNIRCNSINPGATRTTMRQSAYPAENPATLRRPEEIMGSYLYLMGDESQSITGEAWDAQPRKTK